MDDMNSTIVRLERHDADAERRCAEAQQQRADARSRSPGAARPPGSAGRSPPSRSRTSCTRRRSPSAATTQPSRAEAVVQVRAGQQADQERPRHVDHQGGQREHPRPAGAHRAVDDEPRRRTDPAEHGDQQQGHGASSGSGRRSWRQRWCRAPSATPATHASSPSTTLEHPVHQRHRRLTAREQPLHLEGQAAERGEPAEHPGARTEPDQPAPSATPDPGAAEPPAGPRAGTTPAGSRRTSPSAIRSARRRPSRVSAQRAAVVPPHRRPRRPRPGAGRGAADRVTGGPLEGRGRS